MLDLSKDWFEVVDEKGNVTRHDILFSFDSEIDDNTYIVHTANEKDEDGSILVYASYINEEKHGNKLMNVDDDDVFGTIESMLVTLTGIARGYTEESYIS